VRGVVIRELGQPPEVGDAPDPATSEGEVLVQILAAPLNPIDLAVAAGRLPAGHPPLPYVAGCEGVGRANGDLVWVSRAGVGMVRNGCMADSVAAPADALVPVPEGADAAIAGAMGIAGMAGWTPFAWRTPVRQDDVVLVLGATGTVGTVAVQAARVLGARRVVAVGRNPEALDRLDADAKVRLDGGDLVTAFRDACDGGPTLVFDPLWGDPITAAVEAAAPGARVVQLGQSAAPTASLASAAIRFKGIEIYGYSNFNVPRDVLEREYTRLVEHAMRGDIRVDVERVPLDEVAEAWRRQAESPNRKLVLVP
jgi:NADPH:quinone reductase